METNMEDGGDGDETVKLWVEERKNIKPVPELTKD